MGLASYGVLDRQLTNRERWTTFWVLFVFAGVCMYSFCKVNAFLTVLAPMFGFDTASMGNIATIATLTGVIFAFPIAFIMRRLGTKFSVIVTAVCMIVGSLICIYANGGAMFLAGRFFEGAGFGFIAVIGPNVMPRIFPAEKLGIAMGIWSVWVTPGIILGAGITPSLFATWGWTSLFWSSIILDVVSLALVLVFVKMPAVDENTIVKGDVSKKRVYGKSYMLAGILLSLVFLVYNFGYGAFNTFYPTYLQTVQGWEIAVSSYQSLFVAVVTVPAGFLFGHLIDRFHCGKWIMVLGLVFFVGLYGTFAWSNSPMDAVLPWVFGLFLGFICAACVPVAARTLIPILVKEPTKTDYVLTFMAFNSQLGVLLVGLLFGVIVAATSWYTAALVVAILCAACTVLVVLLVPSDKKVVAETEALQGE